MPLRRRYLAENSERIPVGFFNGAAWRRQAALVLERVRRRAASGHGSDRLGRDERTGHRIGTRLGLRGAVPFGGRNADGPDSAAAGEFLAELLGPHDVDDERKSFIVVELERQQH